jgi:hypothetical protein
MAAPNRKIHLKKSQSLIEIPFMWLNNLNFIEHRKPIFSYKILVSRPLGLLKGTAGTARMKIKPLLLEAAKGHSSGPAG